MNKYRKRCAVAFPTKSPNDWKHQMLAYSSGSIQLPPLQPVNHLIYSVPFHSREFTSEESKSNNDAFV